MKLQNMHMHLTIQNCGKHKSVVDQQRSPYSFNNFHKLVTCACCGRIGSRKSTDVKCEFELFAWNLSCKKQQLYVKMWRTLGLLNFEILTQLCDWIHPHIENYKNQVINSMKHSLYLISLQQCAVVIINIKCSEWRKHLWCILLMMTLYKSFLTFSKFVFFSLCKCSFENATIKFAVQQW